MLHEIALGIVIALIFTSLLVIFCVLLAKLYIRKIKNYTRLIYQKDLEHQKELTLAVMETQEQVLANISQDLHDDAGQQLTYINFQLENLKLDSAALSGVLQPLSDSVGQLSETIRGISHSLSNQLLIRQDLMKAMENEINRLQKNGRLSLTASIDDCERSFTVDQKIVIYRIFQESLNNILKHSKAKNVEIGITAEPFSLKITDDGKGFDANDQNNNVSFGLSNMEQRAGIIGYSFEIRSVIEKGTTISLSEKQ